MHPLSPLDGRYSKSVDELRAYFSEEALMRARVIVEIRYLEALSEERGVKEFRLSAKDRKALQGVIDRFGTRDIEKIRSLEKETNHDVKAVEYYLRKELKRIGGAKAKDEFVHFGLTSEDVNNLAYGFLIHDALRMVLRPELQSLVSSLRTLAGSSKKRAMLSLTHGQPATPTTLGKEMMVFVDRLLRQYADVTKFQMQGKFGGAVGNYAAHRAAYPDVNWERFGVRFVKSLKLDPIRSTTQINPHDDLAEISHLFVRINTILLDLSRDVWSYISRGVFRQRAKAGEVGSSTMPHKVNPIDFENAEGNLGISSALFDHFALKLPVSRLQRDLSDSTVQRNLGVAFGHHLLAVRSIVKGLKKLVVDRTVLDEELHAHPEVWTEAIQTVLRKNGFSNAYEQMKALSRGKRVTRQTLKEFVEKAEIGKEDRERLIDLLG